MKTLHNPIAIGVISSVIIGGVIFVMFQTIISGPADITNNIVILPSMQHQTNGNVEIQNIQVQPSTVRIGDTFTISATLINNSQNPIYVNFSPREDPFFVIFDSHVTVDVKQIVIEDVLITKKVNPGEKTIKVGPISTTTFRATAIGTTNATVTFSYFENNQARHSKTISKSFLFTISNPTFEEQHGGISYHIYFPGSPPPIVDTRIAKIVSGTQKAQSIVGYHVSMPYYLPSGYAIQAILAGDSPKFVKILASNFPVTQNTTSVEFMDNKGIMIYMEPNTSAFNQTRWTDLYIKQNLGTAAIKIAGYDGVINDIMKGKRFDEDIDIPAGLVIFRNDNVMVEITGFVHSDELVKIAESILKS